jgi:ATP-dependent protease HslVU (ClpYQ) peptidase subunit
MTTVVCTREEMASDSLLSGDYRATAKKIWKVKGSIVGIAGTYRDCVQFVKWLKGELDECPDMEEVDAIVVTQSGKILHYNGSADPFEVNDDFSAIGSGAQAAMAAMHMGASVERAIEIAVLVDGGSGGKTQYHKITKRKRRNG